VYNAEKYLAECIESLVSQTLKECEFIFVNDGSSDRSREIIDEYKKKDSRIILINQVNQGVSIARNQGLKTAIGEYVGFVDADDFVAKDMYETLYRTAKNGICDVVFSNLNSEMEGKKVVINYPFQKDILLDKEYIRKNILLHFIKEENMNSVCNKIYRNSLVKDNKIEFPERVALGEDGMFNVHFFSIAYNATYLNYGGYYYREVAGSATRNFLDHDYFQRSLEAYSMEIPEVYKQIIDKQEIQKLKSIKLMNSILGYIYQAISSNSNLKQKYQYIHRVITNEHVRESLPIYYQKFYGSSGLYQRSVLTMIKIKSVLGLYIITLYSHLRNNNNGGI
jgi:glycosyltransferase involved in cell wall biosynthesis